MSTRGPRPFHVRRCSPFWDRVDKTGECWLWLGARISAGYGHMRGIGYAHRHSWVEIHGPIPVLEIRNLAAEGVGPAELARKYGVVRTTIGHVLRGETWAWLTEDHIRPTGELTLGLAS